MSGRFEGFRRFRRVGRGCGLRQFCTVRLSPNVVEGLSHVSRSESEGERGGYGDGAGDGRAGWLTGRERL